MLPWAVTIVASYVITRMFDLVRVASKDGEPFTMTAISAAVTIVIAIVGTIAVWQASTEAAAAIEEILPWAR